ncbi:pentatricopeptide repeat-containing protein At4g02820, mitochondrial isoform X2 [Spinacia oleracea]|uniref:Pentatricopeptide repeat-containing protein At4g02820, mitochondrial isoform X2 n=1 Tax=Spinacia oleracea TaxID=3562 RepID=A0ABM3RN44_SPIOL|nr:pentatricopeptide repeat-containing protein At4g02820, mitochondrial isoform X2 [Spinacia oleracea]
MSSIVLFVSFVNSSASNTPLSEWMRTQEDIKLLAGDYAVHLDLIAKIRGLNSAEKFFEDMPEAMRAEPTFSALLHTYVQHRAHDKAEALMGKMVECGYVNNPLPYNHMMSMYKEIGKLEKIPELMKDLKKNTKPDIVSYNLWLTICQFQNDVKAAESVFLEMKKAKIEPDWMTYSILTSLYIKMEMNGKAECSFKEMESRISRKNRSAYSSLISLYTNFGKIDQVHNVWKKMKSLFRKLNDSEYICIIASLIKLGELEKAEEFYDEWELVSTTGDCRVPNLLIGAYINRNRVEKATKFFDRFTQRGIKPSYTTWELLTCGYLKLKQTDQVLDSFEKAVNSVKKWEPNLSFIHEIYKLLEEQENIEGAEKMLFLLRKAGYVTTEMYNMLLRTYASAGKMPPIIEERMTKDKVLLNEDTKELVRLTSTMCVADVSSCLS